MSPSTAVSPARTDSERPHPGRPSLPHPIAAKIRAHGFVCFRVLGASMFPWIRTGDLAFVRRFPMEMVARGDVILFERESRLFVHRVLRRLPIEAGAKNQLALLTKGDTLDKEDAPISHAEYLGRVTRIHRGRRHIDLESLVQVALGRILARVSMASFLVYQPLRLVKHFVLG
jgi:signal peptidase I